MICIVSSITSVGQPALYEAPRPQVVRAAILRAQAGALRDAEAERPDWEAVSQLLHESYRDLHQALGSGGTH